MEKKIISNDRCGVSILDTYLEITWDGETGIDHYGNEWDNPNDPSIKPGPSLDYIFDMYNKKKQEEEEKKINWILTEIDQSNGILKGTKVGMSYDLSKMSEDQRRKFIIDNKFPFDFLFVAGH